MRPDDWRIIRPLLFGGTAQMHGYPRSIVALRENQNSLEVVGPSDWGEFASRGALRKAHGIHGTCPAKFVRIDEAFLI